MQGKIDRSSPVPFYYQLKQLLVADLESRALSPGDRLSGDHELCDTYGVSRDRKSTRLNSSHANISYALFCLKKKHKRRLSDVNFRRETHTPRESPRAYER